MAILTPGRGESSHWYTTTGRAMHTIPTADGRDEIATTLRDARTMHLLPSVTAITKLIDKPALVKWRLMQAVLAAVSTPISGRESLDYWIQRVLDRAGEQVTDAANLGGRIHNALEKAWLGTPVPTALESYCWPVLQWQADRGLRAISIEETLVNKEHGFAGRCDLLFTWGDPAAMNLGILDYKTKKTKPGEPVASYIDQVMQLAAYAATKWGEAALPRVYAANIFISTTEPGRKEVTPHAPPQLLNAWEAFKALCVVWRALNEYDPRQAFRAS